jgi:hypothetical protein
MESPENGGACFPPFPQTLEIEKADFHIPSAPGRDDEYNSSFKTRKDKNPASPTLRFLQAHPWIGKDCEALQQNRRDAAPRQASGQLKSCANGDEA